MPGSGWRPKERKGWSRGIHVGEADPALPLAAPQLGSAWKPESRKQEVRFWGQRHGPCWHCLPAFPCARWASGGLGRRGEVFWLKKLWYKIRWHITQWDLTYNSVSWESPERILYAMHLSKYLRYSSKQNQNPCPHGAFNNAHIEYVNYIAL